MKTTLKELRQVIHEVLVLEKKKEFADKNFKVGDLVLFGKYKNKKGKIVDVYLDDREHPTIDIEPVPKGRKKTVTMGLYKIWKADDES